MKADFHLHLEEGPYTSGWLQRTFNSILELTETTNRKQSLQWMNEGFGLLDQRMQHGAFSSYWLDLYLIQAKRMGMQEVGIVDHLYRFTEYKSYYQKNMIIDDTPLGIMQREWLDNVCTVSVTSFVEFIQQQKDKWKQEGIDLRLGVEADYYPGCEEELSAILSEQPYDYVIGSVHFVDGWGFDNPETADRFEQFDLESLYRRFFQIVGQAISSKLFDFVAHLDNLKVFCHRPDERILLPMYEEIAELLIATDTATEINAGLYYRYPIKEMCPSPTFLKVLSDKGVKITTSTDAHFPQDLGSYTAQQMELLKEAGFKVIVTFVDRKRLSHSL